MSRRRFANWVIIIIWTKTSGPGDCGRDRLVMQRCQGDFRESSYYQGTIYPHRCQSECRTGGQLLGNAEHGHNSSLVYRQRKLLTFI